MVMLLIVFGGALRKCEAGIKRCVSSILELVIVPVSSVTVHTPESHVLVARCAWWQAEEVVRQAFSQEAQYVFGREHIIHPVISA